MKDYTVMMPFTGVAVKTITAESEEEAIQKFLDEASLPITPPRRGDAEITEWNFCEQIVRGNVFYGVQNEVDVQED